MKAAPGPGSSEPTPAFGPPVPPPQPGERLLFLADLTHPWAAPVAEAGQLVLSEAGGAAGSATLAAGMHLIAAPGFLDAARPDRVIVLGRPTLFRPLQRLLADPRVTVDVIAHPQGYADPAGTARVVAAGWPDLRELPDPAWAAYWRDANAACGTSGSVGAGRAGHRRVATAGRATWWRPCRRRATLVLGLLAVTA